MVGAQEQALERVGILVWLLVAVKAVGVQRGALHEARDDVVADVVGHLPAERLGGELGRAGLNDPGRDPGPLGVELRAVAESGEDDPVGLGSA